MDLGAQSGFAPNVAGTPAGYFELEAQERGNVEIAYFGLLPRFIGRGLGGALLTATVEPWHGHYLTHEDVGEWKGLQPLVWDREPTVEEIARRIYAALSDKLPGLIEVALVESTEFDRSRTVRFTRCESDKH